MTRLIFAASCIISVHALYGQTDLFAKIGANGSWVTNDAFGNYEMRPGIVSGLGIEKSNVTNSLDLSLEACFSIMNSSGQIGFDLLTYSHRMRMNHLDITGIASISIWARIKVLSGVQYGHLLLARSSIDENIFSSDDIVTYDLNRNNWSLVFGLERDLSKNIAVGSRFNYGVSKLGIKGIGSQPPERDLRYPRSIQLYLKFQIYKVE